MMRLSTRTRYGIRAVFELARHFGKGPVQLRIIAEKQDISAKYLEQLIAILKSGGFVKSIRGSKGGYVLANKPSEIKLSDCVRCLEGQLTTVECVDDSEYCQKSEDCVVKQVWVKVTEAVENILQSITLQDLLDRAENRKTSDYQI
jgi:Rrf2 family cysteine metabolism transcriptional repressor